MEAKKIIGIWIRVSTEDQAKGESPEHHEKRAQLYAEAKGWVVKEVYHLEAVSGKSVMGHSETKRMLKDIKEGHITGIIFSKLARLARNTKELLEFADIFREYNADLISLQESIDTSTPAGRLFYTMIAAMAQWEREEISDRVAASVPIRAKLGKPIGGQASFGYRWEDKELVVDQKEAPIRKLVYELFRDHKRKGTVAKLLNEKGYRTRNGSLFTDTTIGRLLRDSTAKGIRIANYSKSLGEGKNWVLKPESEWVQTPCPAIVSEDLWNECNVIMDKQEKKREPVAKKPTHLFTGILYCECGQKMYVPSKSKKYICYSCKNKIMCDDLEEIYYEHLKSFLLTDQQIGTFLSKADELIIEKENQIKSLKKEMERIETEMEKLVSLHMTGEIPKVGFGKHYNPLFEQQKQIEAHIPELQSEIDFLKIEHMNGGHLLHEAKNLYDRWPMFDTDAKRQVIEQVTSSLSVSSEEIKIKFSYAPSIFQIAPDSQRNLIPALAFCEMVFSSDKPTGIKVSFVPQTIGEHIRKIRLEKGLFQEDVAKLIGVSTDCITNWENNHGIPQIQFMPAIIEFLGFVPIEIDNDTLGGQMLLYRNLHGLSHRKLGKLIGVDASTIGSWEKGLSIPQKNKLQNLLKVIRTHRI